MKKYAIIVFSLLGVFVVFSGVHSFNSSQKLQIIKTDSDLKLLFFKDSSLPYIEYSVLFSGAGADYDPIGKSGLAGLTAYLLDQGAGGMSSAVLQKELNQLGTELNVEVGRQFVSLSLSGLSWHKEKLLNLFEKILSDPHFSAEELAILKKRMINRRIKSLDRPASVANAIVRKQLFKGSLGESINGTLLSLPEINLEDIKKFYQEKYKAGSPIFMIAGDFDRDLKQKITSFVNQNFSNTENNEALSIPVIKEPAEILLISNEELVQAEMRLAYSLFPFPTQNPREALAMKLANSILGGGSMVSRLFLELREKKGLTYGSYTSINLGKFYGFFDFYGATKTETLNTFLEQTLLELRKIKEQGLNEEELETAKQILKISYLKNIETIENQLNSIAYYNHYLGVEPDFLENYVAILEDLSLDEVNQSLEKFISMDSIQILIYGHPSIQSQLEAMDIPWPIQVISFKDYFKEELELKPSLIQQMQ